MLLDYFDVDNMLVLGNVKEREGVILLHVGMGRGDEEDKALLVFNKTMAESLSRQLQQLVEDDSDVEVKQDQNEVVYSIDVEKKYEELRNATEDYASKSRTFIQNLPKIRPGTQEYFKMLSELEFSYQRLRSVLA